uniref:Uncharacterized protein n=1 Tax=Parastrongyloides trichosuri TaxID=131310 RepID=A0A0N4ZYJ7_PARTI
MDVKTKLTCSKYVINILRSTHHNSTPNKPNLALFRRINELASSGKWDNINNAPKLILFGNNKKEAYKAFGELLETKNSYFERTPWGKHLKFITRCGLFIITSFAVFKGYELIFPETYRMAIKYAPKHHEEHH